MEKAMVFWRGYLKNPRKIGAVAPSSKHLARKMVQALDAKPDDICVELGPGTGVFTEQMIAEGIPEENIILIEFNHRFAFLLKQRFPKATLVQGDASKLPRILHQMDIKHVPRIISGLPLRSMKWREKTAIALSVSQALSPGGTFVQFTYFNGDPLPKTACKRYNLSGERVSLVVRNVPPAIVWRYRKSDVI
jgi:phosphatidylethanolamine/phosphatidyl-N-methylethanolamine N-methyltransferase